MKLTAIIEKSPDGCYVGQIQEFPAAVSQGKTIKVWKIDLLDALKVLMETNRQETEKIKQVKPYWEKSLSSADEAK